MLASVNILRVILFMLFRSRFLLEAALASSGSVGVYLTVEQILGILEVALEVFECHSGSIRLSLMKSGLDGVGDLY